ncbi:addiction module toxin, RelE/StbE family [Bacteroidales bacterium Barb7]|nr:addiction module toxin, RelE/StbE family [Bacteroidales bacterium Barb7]
MYNVIINKKVYKEISDIPDLYAKKIIKAIYGLEYNPRPNGSRKLSGFKDLYRIRISIYRVIYRIENDKLIVEVIKVDHRSSVYQ